MSGQSTWNSSTEEERELWLENARQNSAFGKDIPDSVIDEQWSHIEGKWQNPLYETYFKGETDKKIIQKPKYHPIKGISKLDYRRAVSLQNRQLGIKLSSSRNTRRQRKSNRMGEVY